MESNYIITSDGRLITEAELIHAGTKGMQWGKRLYQNKDGSLTPLGRLRYLKSDGNLNEAGKKYYAKEAQLLKEKKARLRNMQKADAKLAKNEKLREEVEKLETIEKKMQKSERVDTTPTKPKASSDMSDSELQSKVNRLRNEDAYRDLNKKLGYNDEPKTELDTQIAEMKKQKEYLELKRDIKNLTPEKENKIKKIMDKVVDDLLIPSMVASGKTVLTNYLTEAGSLAISKSLSKEKEKIENMLVDSAQRVENRKAKAAAKAQAKAAKEAAAKKKADEAKAAKEAAAKKKADEEKAKKEAVDKKKADEEKAAKEAASKKKADEMDKYNKYQEDYANSLKPDSASPYHSRGGDRDYVNPSEPRGLSIFGSSNKSMTTSAAASRGKTYVDDAVSSNTTELSVISKIGTMTSSGKKSYSEIADSLGVSLSTVQKYSNQSNGRDYVNKHDDDQYMTYDEDGRYTGYWSDIKGDSDGII